MTIPRLLLPVLLLLSSCRAAPPPAAVRSDFGVVRAATDEQARRVSGLSERLIPRLRDLLPGLRDHDLEVWVQKEIELVRGSPYPEHIAGMADYENGRIHLRRSDTSLELHLAHELVHVLLDDSWSSLPGVLEEGLCDLVAALLTGQEGEAHHARRLVESTAFFGGFDVIIDVRNQNRRYHGRKVGHRMKLSFEKLSELTVNEVLELDDEQVFKHATEDTGVGLYGLGYLVTLAIVERIGFEGLHALCSRTDQHGVEQIPASVICLSAGAGEDGRGLPRLLMSFLGSDELPVLARVLADGLAEAAAGVGRSEFEDAEQFLEEGDPRLGLVGHSSRIALRGVEEFRDQLRKRW